VLKRMMLLVITLTVLFISASCAASPPATTTPPTALTASGLRYRVLDAFPNYFWCDPDFYPIGRPGGELDNALSQFDSIRSNDEEFTTILNRIGIDRKPSYTPDEKLLIYRQHKLLTKVLVDFQPAKDGFTFVIRSGQGQGERIEGNISAGGTVNITKRDTSFNTCPICLSYGTLIDTPDGKVAVQDLSSGILIWTLDENGSKIAEPIIETTMTPVPTSFELSRIVMWDGRTITVSPGHPAADGRFLGTLKPGDLLDGSVVESIETVAYQGRTYDILPSGVTGLYWANGILLASTLAIPDCGC
jgi:hypothetical protein